MERLKQASMDYLNLYMEYCNAIRDIILKDGVREIPLTYILNGPFFLNQKALDITLEKLNDFTESFGYNCLIKGNKIVFTNKKLA